MEYNALLIKESITPNLSSKTNLVLLSLLSILKHRFPISTKFPKAL